jgi:CRP-like cAMP-binding protein
MSVLAEERNVPGMMLQDSSETTWTAGEVIWTEGAVDLKPLRVRQGILAYRRGNIGVGILGPGQVALPVPGIAGEGPAAADLLALTEAVAVELDPELPLRQHDLEASALAVVTAADRLGNLSLPQRLAALLLDITDLTGQPVIGCRQDIIAMAAAARRETVATILSSWRDEDWIQTRYRRCKVLERDALIRIRDRR